MTNIFWTEDFSRFYFQWKRWVNRKWWQLWIRKPKAFSGSMFKDFDPYRQTQRYYKNYTNEERRLLSLQMIEFKIYSNNSMFNNPA